MKAHARYELDLVSGSHASPYIGQTALQCKATHSVSVHDTSNLSWQPPRNTLPGGTRKQKQTRGLGLRQQTAYTRHKWQHCCCSEQPSRVHASLKLGEKPCQVTTLPNKFWLRSHEGVGNQLHMALCM